MLPAHRWLVLSLPTSQIETFETLKDSKPCITEPGIPHLHLGRVDSEVAGQACFLRVLPQDREAERVEGANPDMFTRSHVLLSETGQLGERAHPMQKVLPSTAGELENRRGLQSERVEHAVGQLALFGLIFELKRSRAEVDLEPPDPVQDT